MNNVAGAVMLVFTLLAPMAVYFAYLLLRRIKGGRWIGLGLAVASIALLMLGAAQLFGGGDLVEGEIARKSETVQLARLQLIPSVLHILRVEVRTGAPETGLTGGSLMLAVAPQAFDALHEAESVRLRQTAIGPLRFARLADAPAWSQIPQQEFTGLLAFFASAVSLLTIAAGVLTPVMRWPGRAAFVVLAVLAAGIDATATKSWWAPRTRVAAAKVMETRLVAEALVPSRTRRHSTEVFPLPKPYDEVTLRLTPAAGVDPVIAIDRVDAGSAGNLTVGDTIPVALDPGDPRDARLTVGTRSYALAAYLARFGGLAALGAVAALSLFAAMVWIDRRQAARPASSPPPVA